MEKTPMHQIQLSDDVFHTAQQRALEFGYSNVDEYVTAMIREDQEPTLPDDFFTPERLKEIDEAVAQADAGLLLTSEQVDQQLAEHRQAWLDKRKN